MTNKRFYNSNNRAVRPNSLCHAEQSEASRAGTLQETLRDPSYRQDDTRRRVNYYIITKIFMEICGAIYGDLRSKNTAMMDLYNTNEHK